MDKAIAKARQIAAQEATAEGVAQILARLDAIEAKLDAALFPTPAEVTPAEKPAPKSEKAGKANKVLADQNDEPKELKTAGA